MSGPTAQDGEPTVVRKEAPIDAACHNDEHAVRHTDADIETISKWDGDAPDTNSSGWPEPKPKNKPATPEEQAWSIWNEIQQKAILASREILSWKNDSDGDETEDEDEMTDDEDVCDEQYYNSFLNLFEEDSELKGYYKKNCSGGGDFVCLVCRGCGENLSRRYPDCNALLQHAVSIAKTKRRIAHRVYVQVVCYVLGWEIDKLPSIVSNPKPNNSQGNPGNGDKKPSDGEGFEKTGNLPKKAPDESNLVDGELMFRKISLPIADAVRSTVDPDKLVANEEEENAEAVVQSLCRSVSTGLSLEAGHEVNQC